MNKMREYERGREDGLDLALRIVRQGGIEALEKEVRFRNITGVHTSLAVKDLDKASEQIKAMTLRCTSCNGWTSCSFFCRSSTGTDMAS